jgi:hypothetical protein
MKSGGSLGPTKNQDTVASAELEPVYVTQGCTLAINA